jgi:hypothetical protein
MPGSTFRTSPDQRLRRRTDGPALRLVVGTGTNSRTTSRDTRPAHPAQEGFTPDGIPSHQRDTAVQVSEPGPAPSRRTSRGNATLDSEGRAASGSGPIDRRAELIGLIAGFLDDHAGDGAGSGDSGASGQLG